MGDHYWVMQFLCGARRLHPLRQRHVAVRDLLLVLPALSEPPFEPMSDTALQVLAFKTTFLLSATTPKRMDELHVLSVSPACLHWKVGCSDMTLWRN